MNGINSKIRILFVLENWFPHIGGIETLFSNLCHGLSQSGHDVSIVTHRMKNTKIFEEINGVKVYRISCFQNRYLFTFFSIPRVLSLAKKVDIIHATTFNGAPPAWLASTIFGKPKVLTVAEVWIGRWGEFTSLRKISCRIHEFLEKLIYLLKFDKYLAISNSTKSQLTSIKIRTENIEVIYPGVDYKHWDPSLYDGKRRRKSLGLGKNFTCIVIGRPGPSKGIDYLIKAIPLITKKIPNVKLLAILSRDKSYEKEYNEIAKLIKTLSIEDKVILHCPVKYEELPSFIKSADCVLVPSLAEGFGYAAVEACAMNVPVVASNTTSLREVVSGKHVLIKPRDPGAIAAGVERIFNKNYRETNIKKFTSEENVNSHLKVYKELISNTK